MLQRYIPASLVKDISTLPLWTLKRKRNNYVANARPCCGHKAAAADQVRYNPYLLALNQT